MTLWLDISREKSQLATIVAGDISAGARGSDQAEVKVGRIVGSSSFPV
jgi:hypothetical protein